jgi:hypothetical protein
VIARVVEEVGLVAVVGCSEGAETDWRRGRKRGIVAAGQGEMNRDRFSILYKGVQGVRKKRRGEEDGEEGRAEGRYGRERLRRGGANYRVQYGSTHWRLGKKEERNSTDRVFEERKIERSDVLSAKASAYGCPLRP